MLSTEKTTAKSLAPEITPWSVLNSVSIQSMKSEIPKLAGRGEGRTPKFFRDFSYSSNNSFSLLIISGIFLPEVSL
jgi:hypothetical protein